MKQRLLISADILVDFTGMLKYNDTVKIKYDQFGNLYSKEDLFTGTTYRYNYDLSGRTLGINPQIQSYD